jgi:hypothetical protein
MGSRVREIGWFLALVGASLAISGCSSGGASKSDRKTKPPVARVDGSLDALGPNPEIETLAEQSQRDVEAIFKAQAAARKRKAVEEAANHDTGVTDVPSSSLSLSSIASAAPIAPPPPVNPPATKKTVVWNDESPAPASTTRPAEPDVHQSPLFREPVEDVPTAAAAPATSQPSGTLEPDHLQKLMVDLSRELYAKGAYSDAPLRQLMVIAAMGMVDPHRALDPQAIPDLTENERELLGKLQTFFAELGKGMDAKADTEQAVVDAVNKLRDSLVTQAFDSDAVHARRRLRRLHRIPARHGRLG